MKVVTRGFDKSGLSRAGRAGASIAIVLMLSMATGACLAQEPQGDWKGALEVGAAKLRLQLHVNKDAAGAYTATLDSLDQGAMAIPVEKVTLAGQSLTLDFPSLQAVYQATISADGSKIEGTFSQSGRSLPLVFERGQYAQAKTGKGRPMTDEERATLIAQLERTQKVFADSLAGVTPEQWTFKPAPDRWSIAEVAEHLVKAEELLLSYTTGQVLKIPTPGDFTELTPEQYKEADAKALAIAVDRSKKAQAIEPLRPTGVYKTVDEAVKAFAERRAKSIEYARTSTDDLRSHFTPHPALGRMDAYQYLLTLAGHVERHVAQINEIKASANYPK
jgi:hypothetical protein